MSRVQPIGLRRIRLKVCAAWIAMSLLLTVPAPVVLAQQAQVPARTLVRTLPFRLYLNEVFPQAVTVEEGWYAIRLINGVSTEALNLTLDDEQSRTVAAKAVASRVGRSELVVHLTPGKRVLGIAGHPKWRAEITITARK